MATHLPGIYLLDDTKLPDYSSHFAPYHLAPIPVSASNITAYIDDLISDLTTAAGTDSELPKTVNQLMVNAAYNGDLGCLRYYQNQNFSLDIASSAGVSLYSAALVRGQNSVLSWLTEQNVNTNVAGNVIPPLWVCCFEGLDETCEILLKNGADANWQDCAGGRTAVMVAAQQGHLNVIKMLVKYGATLNLCSNGGHQALDYALFFGQRSTVEFLINELKVARKHLSVLGSRELFVAIKGGHTETFQLVRETVDNFGDICENGMTPFMVTCYAGHMEMIKCFTEKEACVYTKNGHGMTAFLYACGCETFEVAQYLCSSLDKNKELFSFRDSCANNALIIGSTTGNLELVKLLISHVDINESNCEGTTALMAASKQGHTEVVSFLLRHSANAMSVNKDNMTALSLAYAYQHFHVVETFSKNGITLSSLNIKDAIQLLSAVCGGDQNFVQNLLSSSCSANMTNIMGETPLMIASYLGNLDMMRLLLQKGASVKFRNKQGCSALEYAVDSNCIAASDLLLGYGGALSYSDTSGRNLLHRTVLSGCLDFVHRALNLGAQIDLTDGDGNTALNLATQNDFQDIALLLITLGAHTTIRNQDGMHALDYAFVNNAASVLSALQDSTDVNVEAVQASQRMIIYCQKESTVEIEKMINHNGSIVNSRDSLNSGLTPFIIAITDAKINIAQLLYRYGSNVNVFYSSEYITALQHLAKNDEIDILKWLVTCDIYMNTVTMTGRTPLINAALEKKVENAKILIRAGALMNVKEIEGFSALMVSTLKEHHEMLELLLKSKAFVDIVDNDGDTPLSVACSNGDVCSVKLLVEHGASVNISNQSGYNPLMIAAKKGCVEVLPYLMEYGADLTTLCNSGFTARGLATLEENWEVVQWLDNHRSMGSSVGLVNNSITQARSTNTDIAHETSAKHFPKSETCTEGTQGILGKGSRWVTHADKLSTECGKSTAEITGCANEQCPKSIPVSTGCRQSLLSLAECPWGASSKCLVSDAILAGVSINEQNDQGHTPLFLAVHNDNFQMVDCLLELGANINHKDKHGKTFLHLCCESESHQQLAIAERLCSSGVNCNAKDIYGITPLHSCFILGHLRMAQVLLEQGAKLEDCSPDIFAEVGNIAHTEPLKLLLRYGALSPMFHKNMYCSLLCGVIISHTDALGLIQNYFKLPVPSKQSQSIITGVKYWDTVSSQVLDTPMITTNDGPSDHRMQREALRKDYMEIISLLIKANEDNRQKSESAAISLALKWGQYELVQLLTDRALILVGDDCHFATKDSNVVLESQPLDLEKEYKLCVDEVHILMKKLVDRLYQLVLNVFIQSNPKDISGISRGWKNPVVLIHTLEPEQSAATKFIQDLQLKGLPHLSSIDIAPMSQETCAHQLVGDERHHKQMYMTEKECVAVGSKVTIAARSTCHPKTSSSQANHSFATITVFLRSAKDSNSEFWLLTETGECPSSFQPDRICVYKSRGSESVIIQSEYFDTAQEIRKIPCVLGEEYMTVCGTKSCRSICLTMCKITKIDFLPPGSCSMGNIEGVFRGEDKDLLSTTVHKTGASSGRTTGVIIDANTSVRCADGRCYHGTFVVSTLNPALCFAVPGDIGALVCDDSETRALGIVVAAQRNYCSPRDVVFCVRLDSILDYLKDNFGLHLAL